MVVGHRGCRRDVSSKSSVVSGRVQIDDRLLAGGAQWVAHLYLEDVRLND